MKIWYDEYIRRNNPSRFSILKDASDIKEEIWYHTVTLPDGCKIHGTYDMSSALDCCFFENVERKNVLDVGSGDGFFTLDLCRRGANVTAIDAFPIRVKHTKYLTSLWGFTPTVLECDVFSKEFDDMTEKFDLVFSSHVMCHIMEAPELGLGKQQFIERLKSKLTPGGSLVSSASSDNDKQLLQKNFDHIEKKVYPLYQHNIKTVTMVRLWDDE